MSNDNDEHIRILKMSNDLFKEQEEHLEQENALSTVFQKEHYAIATNFVNRIMEILNNGTGKVRTMKPTPPNTSALEARLPMDYFNELEQLNSEE